MLSQKSRLKSEKDFAKLFSKGKSVNGRGIALKFSKNTVGRPRIGFVVSTKISKRAVVRNQIKRRMREAIRPELTSMAASSNDLSFIARSEATAMSFKEIKETIKLLLDKSGLTKSQQR